MSQIIRCKRPSAVSLKSGVFDCLESVFRREKPFQIIETLGPSKSRILVVNHNLLLLEGLAMLIRLQPDMELVGVAASAGEAVEVFLEHRPAIVLLDLDLPEFAGVWSIRQIREADPAVSIIGLLTHPGDERAALALRAGAQRCITQDRLNRDLVILIRECSRPGT